MELKGKKVAILVDQMYQEMEVWVPLYRLQEAGVETECACWEVICRLRWCSTRQK